MQQFRIVITLSREDAEEFAARSNALKVSMRGLMSELANQSISQLLAMSREEFIAAASGSEDGG